MKRICAAALLLALVGCSEGDVESAADDIGALLTEMTVGQIGDMASQILDDPSTADSVLAANGLDVRQLDSLMYEVASDPERRSQYLDALSR